MRQALLAVVKRAREACKNSGYKEEDHFEDVLDMVQIGSDVRREVPDVRLSRYACYLIVQNGDPGKPVIANGQTYFAIQTRRQELAGVPEFAALDEDAKRLAIRQELATHNKYLAAAAQEAGVETSLDYAPVRPCTGLRPGMPHMGKRNGVAARCGVARHGPGGLDWTFPRLGNVSLP